MYKDAKKAISELVANCYDADATSVEILVPQNWKGAGAEIVIEDNGQGMLPDEILEKYLVLGYNKREDVKKTRLQRRPIGSKGLGKLAGLGLAEVMYIVTTKRGRTSRFTIDRQKLEDGIQSLEQAKIEIVTERLGESQGTRVVLKPLHRDIQPVSAEELMSHLSVEYARRPRFSIYVNGTHVSAERLPGKYFEIKDEIKGVGQVRGWYKVLDAPIRMPGFSVRVRGRQVKPRSTFTIGPSASKAINYAYIVGDVEADFLDPVAPRTKLDEFTIATDREGFNEASPSYKALENWAVEKLKRIAGTVQVVRAERVERKVKRNKTIKRALARLPDKVREQTELLVDRLVKEIPWESEEEIVSLTKSLVESRVMDEVMFIFREMLAADDKDVRKFANLLTQYGIADLWRVSGYVAARLEVLKQFERLVMKIGVLERKEIHPVIEKNMWLLSDDYLLLSSNKEMRTHLFRDLGVENAPERDRPDFICRSRPRLLVLIEIKKGAEKLNSETVAQVIKYVDILKKYYPSTPINAYAIGGSCETESTIVHGQTPIRMTTYSELLVDARDRYSEFIKILNAEREI